MKNFTMLAAMGAVMVMAAGPALAHFQQLIPNDANVENVGGTISLEAVFTHPMEHGPVMDMGMPAKMGVMVDGERKDLLSVAKRFEIDGKAAYRLEYPAKKPGDHVFYIEPAPYWEPSEGVMITHYTKVVVDVAAGSGGWDKKVGFPVEIDPLSNPVGLYTGNAFSGLVLKNGAPVPFAEVEVEYKSDGRIQAPTDSHITQVVKADQNGVFHYVMPTAGWWGFAALIEGDTKLKNPAGQEVPWEQGALIWVNALDWPTGQ